MENWFIGLESWQIYGMLFFLMGSNGFFSAPPSELILGIGGFMAGSGRADLFSCIASAFAGNLLGTWLLFWLSKRWGSKAVQRLLSFNPTLKEEVFIAIEFVFKKHGRGIILIGRCLPVIRSVISIPAGMAKMNTFQFLAFSGAGIILWVCGWVLAGYALGDQVYVFIEDSKYIAYSLLIFILGVVFVWLKKQTSRLINEARLWEDKGKGS